MIQVELEVAAIRWVRRQGPPSAIIKRKMYEYLLSYQAFHLQQRRPQYYNSKNLLPSTHFRVLVKKTPSRKESISIS
jgi:hypothetical protein